MQRVFGLCAAPTGTPKKKDTQQFGQRFKRLLMLADGRVSARNARGWKLEGRKEESPGNNVRQLLEKRQDDYKERAQEVERVIGRRRFRA